MVSKQVLSMALELKRRTFECPFCGSAKVRYACFPTVRGYQVAECDECGASAGVEKDSAERQYIFWSKARQRCITESAQKPSEALDDTLAREIIVALA